MECPSIALAHEESSYTSIFCPATLHRYGLPYDFAKMDFYTLPEVCACCNAPLWDPNLQSSRAGRIFVWQSHLGMCGGDGRRLHAHEAMRLAMKRLVLSCPDPSGCAYPRDSILIEPPHLRQDKSRPGDIYTVGNGLQRKNTCMVVVITSALQRSCLSYSSKSSDHSIRKAENDKFMKNVRSALPMQFSATKRLVPLAMNHCGLRGGHFNALLEEYATIMVTRPQGCPLMHGTFAFSTNGALRKILRTWG
jgi:hypothetical protein